MAKKTFRVHINTHAFVGTMNVAADSYEEAEAEALEFVAEMAAA